MGGGGRTQRERLDLGGGGGEGHGQILEAVLWQNPQSPGERGEAGTGVWFTG